jgi:hypothetical protein
VAFELIGKQASVRKVQMGERGVVCLVFCCSSDDVLLWLALLLLLHVSTREEDSLADPLSFLRHGLWRCCWPAAAAAAANACAMLEENSLGDVPSNEAIDSNAAVDQVLLLLLSVCALHREENSLADLLSNLAMDSDAAVDQVLLAWQRGASRGELAALLAAGAQVDGDIK